MGNYDAGLMRRSSEVNRRSERGLSKRDSTERNTNSARRCSSDSDSRDPYISTVPQKEAKKCEWVRENLGKDTNVTSVKSDKPTVVEVRVANLAGSGGFEYHCLQTRGTALVTYKYTDANGGNQEGKLRVFCKAE